jgi:hypothetical protein
LNSIERNADSEQGAGEQRPHYDAAAGQFLAIRRHRQIIVVSAWEFNSALDG